MSSVTGLAQLDRKLKRLADRDARKVKRKAMGKGQAVLVKAIKAEIPADQKSIKKSIGRRYKKSRRSGEMEAKVGANVGKKKGKQVPQAHLVLAGTKERAHQSGKSTGRVEASEAVPRGYQSSKGTAMRVMLAEMQRGIELEASKR